MKSLLLLLSFFTLTSVAFSQDAYLQNSDDSVEERANKITNKYNDILVLDSKQVLKFKKKVTEFLLRADEITDNYTGQEELELLLVNHNNETAEMGDILTRPQLTLYKQYKMEIQPLKQIE